MWSVTFATIDVEDGAGVRFRHDQCLRKIREQGRRPGLAVTGCCIHRTCWKGAAGLHSCDPLETLIVLLRREVTIDRILGDLIMFLGLRARATTIAEKKGATILERGIISTRPA